MPPLHRARDAVIAPSKLTAYLLNLQHSDGGPKAVFLLEHGFTPDKPEQLERALRDHARNCPATPTYHTKWGRKFETRGPLVTPNGRNPIVSAEWQYDTGSNVPRFITRIPGDEP